MNKKHLLLILFLAVYCNTYSCTCIGTASVRDAVKYSDVVIAGKIIAREFFIDSSSGIHIPLVKYSVKITTVFKGADFQKKITIISGIGHGDCGYNFDLNKKYIIYCLWEAKTNLLGTQVHKYLATDICTRTNEYTRTEASQIKRLR
jgi:hypothetical protein